ncbi:MAG TPA: Hsp70 family protein [Chthoniobacterales bacterium]
MNGASFSIGIDLGTTNCAMAFEALDGAAPSDEVFLIPQWESLTGVSEAQTLPSFLYLPTTHEAALVQGKGASPGGWLPGRFARKQAAETPGRVAHSAKSWLCHHAVDRTAPFLPWRSDEIPVDQRISPIQASALLLRCLRAGWDGKFSGKGPDLRFDQQAITVTVPASFDAVAQRLTLEAARDAGFPENVRLLEEPQAAFYYWLGNHPRPEELISRGTGSPHVLVVDIGGGTSDFSLFEVNPGSAGPHIKRVAVSDHLLLGGDNIDLALAHHVAPRLAVEALSGSQWNSLVARCRDLKERCLSDASGQVFPVSIAGRGSSLLGGTLAGQVERKEIESIVLDGFFPECATDAQPARTQGGLREWALPYAADSAITRYLADFLRGRPRVDAVLFNGGSLHPAALRQRLQQQIGRWQEGMAPQILENPEPGLAVARGAARFGGIVHRRAQRIEAGAARAIYLEVHQRAAAEGRAAAPTLVCILPRNAPSEEEFRVAEPGLELRLNRPVRFQPYHSTRHQDRAGSLVTWNDRDFHPLPPLQTTARFSGAADDRLPVYLTARMNELGLLQVACISAAPNVRASWPLEFNLRPHEPGGASRFDEGAGHPDPGVDNAWFEAARARLAAVFSRPLDRHDKLSAATLYKSLEQILRLPRADWNSVLIRSLWSTLFTCLSHRRISVEHEETWLILAGFLLRPGFGVEGDDARIDELWRIHEDGLAYRGKRVQLQLYILWRRVAGGLSRERQEAILVPELPRLHTQKNVPAELVRLAGALERIDVGTKEALVDRFLQTARELAAAKQYGAPYLTALGTLLNRAPLYAEADAVVPPVRVQQAFEAFDDLDWSQTELLEMQTLFLRAARIVNDPAIDVPKGLREKIASKLERSGVAPSRLTRLRTFVPTAGADRASLFGESLPPGLSLKGGSD